VGGQLYKWLQERGVDVAGVSLDRTDGDIEGVRWAFLCLPTPTRDSGAQDIGAFWTVRWQEWARRSVRIVIRSTVLPGTCGFIASHNLTVYHWPEFLSARTAWQDFITPRTRFVGCDMTESSMAAWRDEIEPLLPVAVEATRFMDTATSETIKYAHNVHGAMQIIYANQMYDVCKASGADWPTVSDAMPQLGYVSYRQRGAYWNIFKDAQRGYAGACFPKDVGALRAWLQRQGRPSELLDGMEAANARLRGRA